MFDKGAVLGAAKQPVYAYLTQNAPQNGATKVEVAWNFEKFLVNANGEVVARFSSKIEPMSPELTSAIEKLLAAK
jgi:glutathione peroxidase